MENPYGYYTPSGFKGRLSNGDWMLFASSSDYMEHVEESEDDDRAEYSRS